MRAKPEIAEYLELSMSSLSNKEVRKTDKAVITKVDDGKSIPGQPKGAST
jgi:hypothetical protein